MIPDNVQIAILQIGMAAPNFTGDGQQKTFEDLVCSPDLTAGLRGYLTFLSVLKSFLSVTAFLGNALILTALHKESSLHPPSKLLLRSLAQTDLCVGLIVEPLAVTYCISVVNGNWNTCSLLIEASFITGCWLRPLSFGILAAISVDRLLALLLGLSYRQVVTLNRTYEIVSTLGLLSGIFSTMYFLRKPLTMWYSMIATAMYLIISILSYTTIFFTLRHHQNQVQDQVEQPNQTDQLNIARYKKAVSTAIWLQLTLVACNLPYGIVEALLTVSGSSASLYHAWIYSHTLVYLNSSLNPILYCWKLDEVRQAVKDTIRQAPFLCFSS